MIGKLVILILAISAIEQTVAIPVADVDYVGDRLFKSSPTNYILAGKNLYNLKRWSAVVRNGDQLVVVLPEQCATEVTSVSRIYLEEFRPIMALKATLEKVARPTGSKLAGIVYHDDEEPQRNEADKGAKFEKADGKEVMIRSENEFSIKKDDMQFGLERVFFMDEGMVTLLYQNRRLEMSPINCLPEDMKSYLEQLKSEVKTSEESHE